MRWPLVNIGLSLLLVGAYLDNCRGPLMPLLRETLGLSHSQASWLLVGGYGPSILFTLLLVPLCARFSERKLTVAMLALACVAQLFSFTVVDTVSLLVLSMLLGCAIAGLGALSNILIISGTDNESRGRYLCGLHVMYGIGSFIAPFVVGGFSQLGWIWSSGIWVMLPVVLLLGILSWKFIPAAVAAEAESVSQVSFQWEHFLVLLCFAFYVGGEVLFSMWMVTFLVDARGLEVAAAAPYASFFFLIMGATRALCFFSLRPSQESWVMFLSLGLSISFAVYGYRGHDYALPAAGVLGPFFPILLARVSRRFPREIKPLTVWILVVMQVTLGICHLLVGRLTDQYGIATTYLIPLVLLSGGLLVTLIFDFLPRMRSLQVGRF